MVHFGTKTVTAAGTAEPLVATSTRVAWCVVQPLEDNTDKVYVGDSTLNSGDTPVGGHWIDAAFGQSYTMPDKSVPAYIDLALIYVDANVNGEGVVFSYGR